jgi:hypothetical protein
MSIPQPTPAIVPLAYMQSEEITPEVLAAASQSLSEEPENFIRGLRVVYMECEMIAHGVTPRELVGNLYSPEWASASDNLAALFSPNYTPSQDAQGAGPVLPNWPYRIHEHGLVFILTAYDLHNAMPWSNPVADMEFISNVLAGMVICRMSAAAFLQHWLEYRGPIDITQEMIDGPGLVQILLSSTGPATEALAVEICTHYGIALETSEPTATDFVTALPTIDVSSIPKEDMRCPCCWCDFDEDFTADIDHIVKKTPCGHMFGANCLIESLNGSNTILCCPMCRQDMRALAAQAGLV